MAPPRHRGNGKMTIESILAIMTLLLQVMQLAILLGIMALIAGVWTQNR